MLYIKDCRLSLLCDVVGYGDDPKMYSKIVNNDVVGNPQWLLNSLKDLSLP